VLDGGIVAVHYDFGELRPANLRGNVFVDVDGDLMPDPAITANNIMVLHLP